jgi:hypothetical protein
LGHYFDVTSRRQFDSTANSRVAMRFAVGGRVVRSLCLASGGVDVSGQRVVCFDAATRSLQVGGLDDDRRDPTPRSSLGDVIDAWEQVVIARHEWPSLGTPSLSNTAAG